MSHAPQFYPAEPPPSTAAPIELSEQDLAQISGGVDLSLTLVRFDGSDELSLVSTESDYAALSQASQSSQTRFSVFQINLTGFDSTNSLMKALSSIGRLFGY
ncbi:bacteriocin [Thermoleptolyngbya sp. C42_A2020_037]|uniref:bacteriocin n=1 Tax=Thermoleptolyngbya sp. C42_A2020_037 TaxID=2747799 RepID=UPI0019E797B7|nr:bacteriocin [Thermoleptolyngbya sp. C42_A2020_037]MBF2085452.1 bacteriocin [Thermoleptolyngbya sp. C42_A2020_037]